MLFRRQRNLLADLTIKNGRIIAFDLSERIFDRLVSLERIEIRLNQNVLWCLLPSAALVPLKDPDVWLLVDRSTRIHELFQIASRNNVLLFLNKRRSIGLESPACSNCNNMTGGHEQAAAMLARAYPDARTEDERKDLRRVMSGVSLQAPWTMGSPSKMATYCCLIASPLVFGLEGAYLPQSGRGHFQSAICTNCLPILSPENSAISALGRFSKPSMTVSLLTISPAARRGAR